MPRMEHLEEYVEYMKAIHPISKTTAAYTGVAVDGTGYDRACFFISIGAIPADGAFIGEITQSATSGGTYTLITSSTLTSITGANSNTIAVIDVPVSSSKPFMKVRATSTSAVLASAIAILYNGQEPRPVTQTVQQYIEL